MSNMNEPIFGDIESLSRAAPVHITTKPILRLEMVAKNVHVTRNEATGMYISTAGAILPADDSNDDDAHDHPYIIVGNEEDITSRLAKANKPTFTLPIGTGWANGEKTSMFCFDDAIIEYRKNIDKTSGKINPITNTQPRYMVTYASIGIPIKRYIWLVEYAHLGGVTIVRGAKDQEINGYLWLNVNITREYIPPAIMKLENGAVRIMGTETHNLKTVLMSIRQNLIGVVAMEINLKRTPDFTESNRTYLLSPSLKMMQVVDITNISSPPLTKSVEFRPKDVATSKRLISMLSSKQAQTPQTITEILGAKIAGIPVEDVKETKADESKKEEPKKEAKVGKSN